MPMGINNISLGERAKGRGGCNGIDLRYPREISSPSRHAGRRQRHKVCLEEMSCQTSALSSMVGTCWRIWRYPCGAINEQAPSKICLEVLATGVCQAVVPLYFLFVFYSDLKHHEGKGTIESSLIYDIVISSIPTKLHVFSRQTFGCTFEACSAKGPAVHSDTITDEESIGK